MSSSVKTYIEDAVNRKILSPQKPLFDQVVRDIEEQIRSTPGFALSAKEVRADEKAPLELLGLDLLVHRKNSHAYDFEDANLIVWVDSKLEGNDKTLVKLQLLAPKTGKYAASVVDETRLSNENVSALIRDKVAKGLTLARELISVKADRLLDAERSIVQYTLRSDSGEDVLIKMDYSGDHQEIQNIDFALADKKGPGEYAYRLATEQGDHVMLTYRYEGDQQPHIRIRTSDQPDQSVQRDRQVLTVVSTGGYLIDFEFLWQSGSLANVKTAPRINPFDPIDGLVF